jgi:uncharacterized protein
MNKQIGPGRLVEHQAGIDVGRRNLLKLTGVGIAALGIMPVVDAPAFAQSTLAWDKTFPKSERVDHRKVSFYNRLGITRSPTSISRRTSIARGGMPHSWLAGRSAP